MIDGSEKRNRQLTFELQNSHVCEKRSKFFLYFYTMPGMLRRLSSESFNRLQTPVVNTDSMPD